MGGNGSNPSGGFYNDGTFLYGTTEGGGTSSFGTLYKVLPNGTGYQKLIDFDGTNGSHPNGPVISDGTFLYGTTSAGGASDFGTLYRIMPDGTGYQLLLEFDGTTNGSAPDGTLYFDGSLLYCLTSTGGANDFGTLFKIETAGTGYQKLLDFDGTSNGSWPYGSVVSDGTFLYGMTSSGGTNDLGTIFKIKPDGTSYQKLLDFNGAVNGSYPYSYLISQGGILYGTTNYGGVNDMGTLFKVSDDANTQCG